MPAANCARLMAGLASCGDLDDFDDVAFGEGGGGDFSGEEGDLVVFDDDGFAGEAEALEEVGDGGGGVEGAGLAVDGEGHCGWAGRKWLGGEDGGVPVFPDGVEAEGAEAVGDGGWATLIGDAELAFGAGLIGFVVEFDAAAFDGEVEVV